MRRSDTGPFALVPAWIEEHPQIDDGALRLYVVLARHADTETGTCWPSRARLAERCRCSTDTVDRRLRALVNAGALLIEARADEHGQTTNLYTVLRMNRGRTRAAGGPHRRGGGGRTDAPTGAAPTRPGTRTTELEPVELDRAPAVRAPTLDLGADTFAAFWQVWPRKVAKVRAERAWQQHVVGAVDGQHVVQRAVAFLASLDEPRFCPHPTTWLNAHRWDDELPEAPPDVDEFGNLSDEAAAARAAHLRATGGFV